MSRAAQGQPPECDMDRIDRLWSAVARVTKTNLLVDPRLMLVKRFMNPTVDNVMLNSSVTTNNPPKKLLTTINILF